MATRGVAMVVPFVAWDTVNNEGAVGATGNLVARWIKDGAAPVALTTPAIIESDPTNTPGVYQCNISAVEADCDIGVLCGRSLVAGISWMPVLVQFERLPNAAPNDVGGVRDVGLINGLASSAVNLAEQLQGIESGSAVGVGANTITLASNATTQNVDLTNMVVVITSGGGRVQTRRITAYDTGSQVATVDRNWDGAPALPQIGDNYVILGLIL